MNAVNPPHLLGKLDLAFRAANKTLQSSVTLVPGLRPSHYRLLDFTPAGGIRLSELARSSNITKQALGEFVTNLQTAGLVEVTPDPRDGRARLVTPTPKGRRIQDQIRRTVTAIEQELEQRVGTDRWKVFCQVLDALAAPH
jgi:DNA-binding MarR family transcriptional regulator